MLLRRKKITTSNRKVSVKKQELKQAASQVTMLLKHREAKINDLRKKVLEQLSRLQSEAALLKKSSPSS